LVQAGETERVPLPARFEQPPLTVESMVVVLLEKPPVIVLA